MSKQFKAFKYSCDGGSLAIGNDKFQMRLPNGFGDGTHEVRIYNKEARVPTTLYGYKPRYLGAVEGEFNIYDYDCWYKEELSEHILCTLNGRYGVYSADGYVLFEDWNR